MTNFSILKANITHRKVTASLMLTAILSTIGSLTIINNDPASANPINIHQTNINNNKIQPIPIPENDLPPPLDRGMVFREISNGRITGATYQTVLLNYGLLIPVGIGDANDFECSLRRVSLQEVKKFKKLLNQNNIAKFNNLSYPAPRGASDYITYTLTSQQGTVQ
jgi:hypothetical protein